MTSFILKIIAMFSMVLDHLGDALFKHITGMNIIGRIAFPIFAFQISEGYLHTKNLKKYFLRLFLFALISQIPFLLFYSIFSKDIVLNIFFTLILGLLSIYIYDKIEHSTLSIFKNEKFNKLSKNIFGILIVAFIGIIAEIFKFNYGFWGISIIFLFYFFRNDKIGRTIFFMAACVIKYGIDIIQYGFNIWYVFLCLGTLLSIIFINLYNQKQGKKVKYLLYFFYPVHLLILYFMNYLF